MRDKRYGQCPVCANRKFHKGICSVCGFDESIDYSRFLTLMDIPQDTESVKTAREAYEEKLEEAFAEEPKEQFKDNYQSMLFEASIQPFVDMLGTENLRSLFRQAQAGDNSKALELGRNYDQGIDMAADKLFALTCYEWAASLGNAEAAWRAGWLLCWGEGIDHDEAQGLKYFIQSADMGDVNGKYFVGWCYDKAVGAPKNDAEAIKWYRTVADTNPDAAWRAGWLLCWGENVQHNEQEGFRYFKKSADMGDVEGKHQLAWCYVKGIGTPKNVPEGVKLYQSIADKNSDAAWRAGWYLCWGEDIEHNEQEALRYFKMSADTGNAEGRKYYESLTSSSAT